jgi:hypothetical protein
LQHLSRNVEGKILGVNNSLDEVEVLGNKVFTIVHDEYTLDVKFDVVTLLQTSWTRTGRRERVWECRLLQKDLYSSGVISEGLRVQIGFVLLTNLTPLSP